MAKEDLHEVPVTEEENIWDYLEIISKVETKALMARIAGEMSPGVVAIGLKQPQSRHKLPSLELSGSRIKHNGSRFPWAL